MHKMTKAGVVSVVLLSATVTTSVAAPIRNPLPDPGGVFLTYANHPAVRGTILQSPELTLRILSGGTAIASAQPVMDTGSVGIVVSRDVFGDGKGAGIDTGVPGSINYSSSGKTMSGTTGHASFEILGANGRSATTEAIDFLIVDNVTCSVNARNCVANPNPTGIAMMGVGFGRQGKNGSETFTEARNPFTHVASPSDGATRRGYIVTARGVQVGVNPVQLTGRDFTLVSLRPDMAHQDERHPGDSDWLPQKVGIMVDDQVAEGDVLIDTGVTDMYMTVPYKMSEGLVVSACENTKRKQPTTDPSTCAELQATASKGDYTTWSTLRSGTSVAIGILNGRTPIALSAGYTFRTDGDAAVAPDRLLLVGNLRRLDETVPVTATFVNTSVKFLNGFSYLFDQEDGYTGYRPYAPDTN